MSLNKFRTMPASVMAGMLLAAATAGAASVPLMGRVDLRPLTPSDKTAYGATLQGASGLSTIGVGQPAYLEAQINIAIPASDILSVTWAVSNRPFGSLAVITNSPLGTNVPIYKPADAGIYQVAGRAMLRPDVRGQYTVVATITTGSSGSTNVVQNITAGNYMGVNTCELCHSGGQVAPDIYHSWTNTLHASKFTRGINGLIPGYSKNCYSCHVVGYDVNPLAANGGFDDVATQLGWTFPTVLTNSNFASMPSQLQNLANIQCENCHGPGSEHAYSLGDTNRISVSWNPGDCGQCHDAKTHHIKNPEWAISKHAVSTREPSGPGREGCIGCHTSKGFATRMSGATTKDTTYEAIGCAACHDPHDATNPHQLRKVGAVTLMDGFTTVPNPGNAGLCMNCHLSRRNATNYVDVTAGGRTFGPHEGPQTDMLVGANAITYGKVIPSSAHRDSVKEACVECHMQPTPAPTDPAFLQVGGHTWKMSATINGTNFDNVAACQECHGGIKSFDFPRQDFDGNGIIEGVQTEVQGLLNKLAFLLPPVGVAKSDISIDSTWTKQQLKAGYNYRFVQKDGSLGVHNLAYAVGILKASIADLSGDANNDGIADWWQTQYFGSINSLDAAPNACPAGDGIPNWLKYSLGLNPTQAGITLPDGVMWANGGVQGKPGDPTRIYTAAEVVFNTTAGKTYQLQAISSLGGGWVNVGNPIAGTGNSVSFLTPTRNNTQQFYRVVATP